MAPRTETTRPNQRPVDAALAFYVHFYDPRQKGTWLLWADSREHAEAFAAVHRLFAKPCVVRTRAEWAVGRGLAFAEPAPAAPCCDKGLTPDDVPCSCAAGEQRRILARILAPAQRKAVELLAEKRKAG